MSVVKKSKAGFPGIVAELMLLCQRTNRFDEMVEAILTFNNRLLLQSGLKSLSNIQKSIYQVLEQKEIILLNNSSSILKDQPYITLGMKGFGRIILDINPAIHPTDIIFGYIECSREEYQKIKEMKKIYDDMDQPFNLEVYRNYSDISENKLQEMLDLVSYTLSHNPPVILYVEDETYTTFYEYNNLIAKFKGHGSTYVLDELYQKQIKDWSIQEKILIYGLYWLIKSGLPTKCEEFNGMQLKIRALHEFFAKKIKQYQEVLSLDHPFHLLTIPEKAKLVKQYEKKIANHHLTYRFINGLTLNKSENLLHKGDIPQNCMDSFPQDLKMFMENTYGIDISHYPNPYALFSAWHQKAITKQIINENPHWFDPIEEMLHKIVSSAVSTTHSDIGMSKSFRDYKKLAQFQINLEIEKACAFEPSHFFCCIVPHQEFIKAMENQKNILTSILKSIAVRMQYNAWHVFPGSFPKEHIPETRDYFFPARMPDIAEWSDNHHKGHIFTGVRHSIRSPEKIEYKGGEFVGLVDLRLMRRKGPKYTEEDLKTALLYTNLLKNFYQSLFDTLVNNEKLSYEFQAFTKDWYEECYG